MTHKGIKIQKITEKIIGSDFDVMQDGRIKDRKPQMLTIGYAFSGGYPYDTITEAVAEIDKLYDLYFSSNDATQKEWLEIFA